MLQAAYSLALREVMRFLRQKNRVIGALATPVIFWFVLGSGVGRSLLEAGSRTRIDYLSYFFPGIILLIVLFITGRHFPSLKETSEHSHSWFPYHVTNYFLLSNISCEGILTWDR